MTTISVVNRFLRLSAQEVIDQFKSSFITIDHSQRISSKQANVKRVQSVLNIPDKKAASQTVTLKHNVAEDFNRSILKLYDKVLIEANRNSKPYHDINTVASLCLSESVSAIDTCKQVINAINGLCCTYGTNGSYNKATNLAARAMKDYADKSFIHLVVEYFKDLSSSKKIDEQYVFKDAFKDYKVANYINDINKLDHSEYFGGTTLFNDTYHEYVLLIDIMSLGEFCLSWCKQYKIVLQMPHDKLGSMIRDVVKHCYSNGSTQENVFGYYLYHQYRLDGSTANTDELGRYAFVVVAYNQSSKELYFKQVPS